MPEFRFVAKDRGGKMVEATHEAATRVALLARLREQGLTVIELTPVEAPATGGQEAAARRPRRQKEVLRGRVSLTERAVFCRQLSICVNSGIALRDALEAIADDMGHAYFRTCLRRIVNELHEGRTFSQAAAGVPGVFDPLFVALLRAAEESGSMPQTLEHLADALEARDRLIRKIRSITAYPIFVASFFGIVCVIMTLFVLPQFEDIFRGFGSNLPRLTVAVFGINRFMIDNALLIGIGIAVLLAVLTLYKRTRAGALRIDALKLRLPFFGNLIRKVALARFSRNLAIMLRGGVPVATAMDITASVCDNRKLERALLSAREHVLAGSGIAESLEREGQFPRLTVRMISVGESSGQLPQVLDKVADTYEGQVESSIMTATALFEPIIICVFGFVILMLVLAIYWPVFTVASGMKGG